jgi:signal transduction histidine kinase
MAERVLTNIYEIWTMPHQQKSQPYRIRTEMVIYYFDSEWNNAWGECEGIPAYLPIFDCPTPLKPGQRIAIDGVIVPIRERFIWDQTRVRVLEDAVPLKPEMIRNLSDNPKALKGHLISVEGLIDGLLEDSTHITINFLAGETTAKAYLVKEAKGQPLQLKEGDFVRMECVYSPQFDVNVDINDLSLLVPRPADVEVIGSLNTDRRFNIPITPSQEIREDTPTNDIIHVRGVVRSHEPGKWVTLWDDTGQVIVKSRQTQPLRFGDRVDAIGYPSVVGVEQCLEGSLYRLASSTSNPVSTGRPDKSPLSLAERVRDLSREETTRRLPVNLHAIVTWGHPELPFAYVQDASGGIRVVNPKWEERDAWKPGTIAAVRGEVCEGDYVPVVTNAVISRMSFWNLEPGRAVTLEQALTGVEDGHWVEMRGFVRDVTPTNSLVRLDLSTSSGEFQAWLPASQSLAYLRGSIIRLQGVCAAVSNPRHQLTGIELLAPDVKYLQVEEPAPDDQFSGPLRPLDSLRRFSLQNGLNQRVRTTGTVVLHVPGSYLYVQDGVDSVLALSQQREVLQPGERVEVVGFPGNEGRRFLLREAAYRSLSAGAEPRAVQLSAPHSVNPDLEGLLTRAQGVLLNTVNKEGEERLLVQLKDSTFEASLNLTSAKGAEAAPSLELGSRLAVTGVYQLQSDEYGKPRSFLLRLRSWKDVEILQRPPWWTLARLLSLLLAVLAVSLIVLYWGIVLSRKNRLLSQAQMELQAAHEKLELRVEERTRELQELTQQLQEQVIAKERAREELAVAQRSLMLASRQAGMAEVATGVLHNVGNVLNSVNISATLAMEKVANSSAGNLEKVLALLREHKTDLAGFFAHEQKGSRLIEYLEALHENCAAERDQTTRELKTLTQNIEHIKEIVSMQQSYAQTSGVLEMLTPVELIEDALKMHAAAYQRHAVNLKREFSDVPPIVSDRHKVLQILTNLFHNAKYACDANNTSDRKITVRLGRANANRIKIEVADNGVGIPQENLTRIFSFGFTTRKNGHGFGLHSGALAAKEMGGCLSAQSEGAGKGATFVLELPLNPRSDTKASA